MKVDGLYPAVSCILLYLISCALLKVRVCIRTPLMLDEKQLIMKKNNNKKPKDVDIIFLGFCERAAYVRDGNTNVFKWNVLGLKNIIISNIFPLNLKGWYVGLAVSLNIKDKEHTVRITNDNGNEPKVLIVLSFRFALLTKSSGRTLGLKTITTRKCHT